MRFQRFSSLAILGLVTPFSFLYAQPPGTGGGWTIIEDGMPPVMIHPTVGNTNHARPVGGASTANDLIYGGGAVQTAPKIYLVLWGSQWNNGDPSGESTILQHFYSGIGGSSWLNSVTQYCQGVPTGTVTCNGAGAAVESQALVLGGVWSDNASSAPTHPRQGQLANEALRAAAYFGDKSTNAQYVIATAHGNNSTGFGTQYCAWHSATSGISYTNLPYITDAGASCGANFNGLSADAGITIVSGHEAAESVTDPLPSSGWVDSRGAENGDKCAWISSGQGASADVLFSTGTFAVQSLWSNAFNSGAGGCVLSYP